MAGDLADSIRTARLKCCAFCLRHLVDVAKHLARTRKVKTAPGPQLTQRSQHVVSAVDVHVHRREAVGKTLSHEALRREVIALIEIVFAEYVENAGVTLQAGWVHGYAIEYMGDATEPGFRRLKSHTAHQAVHFVTQTQEIVSEVATVLTGDSGNERFLRHDCVLIREHRRDTCAPPDIIKIRPCLRTLRVLLKMT